MAETVISTAAVTVTIRRTGLNADMAWEVEFSTGGKKPLLFTGAGRTPAAASADAARWYAIHMTRDYGFPCRNRNCTSRLTIEGGICESCHAALSD